jgi:hypothetical protein
MPSQASLISTGQVIHALPSWLTLPANVKPEGQNHIKTFYGCNLRAPALPTNIRLGWKGIPGTNTLAHYENPQITAVKIL